MAKSFTTWINHRKRVKLGATALQSDDMYLVRPFDIDIDVRTCFSLLENGPAVHAAVDSEGGSHDAARHLVLKTIPTIKCAWKMTSLIVQVPIERYSQLLGLLHSNFAMGAFAADTDDGADADIDVSKPIPEAAAVADTATAAKAEAATAINVTTLDTTSKNTVATGTHTSTFIDSISWDVDFTIEDFQFALLARTPANSDDISVVRHLLTFRMAALQARAQCTPQMQQVNTYVAIAISLLGCRVAVAFVLISPMFDVCVYTHSWVLRSACGRCSCKRTLTVRLERHSQTVKTAPYYV